MPRVALPVTVSPARVAVAFALAALADTPPSVSRTVRPCRHRHSLPVELRTPEPMRRSSSPACARANDHLTVDPTITTSPDTPSVTFTPKRQRVRLCDRPYSRLTRSTTRDDSDCSDPPRAATRHRRRRLSARRSTVFAVVVSWRIAAQHRHRTRPATPHASSAARADVRLCATAFTRRRSFACRP